MKTGKLILVSTAAGLLLLGCGSPETRYKVLSFFFDGVPPPSAAPERGPAQEQSTGPKTEQKRRYAEHGPFAAKMCDGCHRRGSNELVMPKEQLCLNCHVMPTDGRKIHGPLASGGCRVCHNPHGSGYPNLLVSDSTEFCQHCHERSAVLSRAVHRGTNAECTSCHDAHSARNAYLLK